MVPWAQAAALRWTVFPCVAANNPSAGQTPGRTRQWLAAPLVLVLALSFTLACDAAQLVGVVVGVSDGDTITVLDASKTQHRIRLAGIDAPELGQAFGQRSKQALSQDVFRQRVRVQWDQHDVYGRIVGKVLVNGMDANLAQVQRGLAWHYRRYAKDQTPQDRQAYAAAEKTARTARDGLWLEPSPVPPWEFRRLRRPPRKH